MLNNLEKLKQELISQKEAIISKGGTIIVANQNPTPSEITEGINSIEMPDLTQTTATVDDVLMGKTFYSGDLFIKTGTRPQPYTDEIIEQLFTYGKTMTTEEKIFFKYPQNTTRVRDYAFYKCPNIIDITFVDSITEIGEYAFYNSPNLSFPNINDLPNLVGIGTYGLYGVKGIDHENLWPTLENAGVNSLTNTARQSQYINLPALKSIGSYAFGDTEKKVHLSHIDFSKVLATTINGYSFLNLIVNSDLSFPTTLNYINSHAFYKGSYNNVFFHKNMKTVADYCFGSSSSDPIDTYQIKTITFESETPPNIGTNFVSQNHVQNGLKIYVPDTAVDTYKALPKLAPYLNIIFPISQRP